MELLRLQSFQESCPKFWFGWNKTSCVSPHLCPAAGLLINAGSLVSTIEAAIHYPIELQTDLREALLSTLLVQVSWLRHYPTTPIPQLLAVNNITNTLDPRTRAVVR